jgi:hypothetical protein
MTEADSNKDIMTATPEFRATGPAGLIGLTELG